MGYKLLLADDSITIQKVVELIIGDEGFELKVTSDGQEALKACREYRPDIVLADVEMPKMNGYELCKNIKSDPVLHSTPVILLVAAFDVFDKQKAAEVKADKRLPKPFGKDEFLSMIEEILGDKMTSESVKEAGMEERHDEQTTYEEEKEELTEEKSIEVVMAESKKGQSEIAPDLPDELSGDKKSFEGPDDSSVLEAPVKMDVSEPAEKMQNTVSEAIENIVENALPDMTSMIMRSIKSSIPDKNIVTAIFKETIKESINETKGEVDQQLTQTIQDAILPSIPEKKEIAVIIKSALAEFLNEIISDEMKEHLTELMHETLVSSFREIILSVAWEVIPRVATSVIEEEIKKLTSNNDE